MILFYRQDDTEREYPLFNGVPYDELSTQDIYDEFGEQIDEADFDYRLNDSYDGVDLTEFGGRNYSFAEALYKIDEEAYYQGFEDYKWGECEYILDDQLYGLAYYGGDTYICGDCIVCEEIDDDDEDDDEDEEELESTPEPEVSSEPVIEFENKFDMLLE